MVALGYNIFDSSWGLEPDGKKVRKLQMQMEFNFFSETNSADRLESQLTAVKALAVARVAATVKRLNFILIVYSDIIVIFDILTMKCHHRRRRVERKLHIFFVALHLPRHRNRSRHPHVI